MNKNDEEYLRRCLNLAKRGLGKTSPNPMVGAVVVKEGRVISEGYHRKAGGPHAEVIALGKAGERSRGATLYVNLEPCSHYGRTPPCADRIIEAGVKRVVVGMVDPNPLVKGKGIEGLRQAGLEVSSGILEQESRRLNEAYQKYITTSLPFVILKMGMSLDSKITSPGQIRITGEKSRRAVHRLRSHLDAILIGQETVAKDDPQLTTRLVKGKDPIRVIVDSKAKISLEARVVTQPSSARTIIATTRLAPAKKIKQLKDKGAEILIVKGKDGLVDLKGLLKKLGELEITSLLVEGGAKIAASFLKESLIDKMMLFVCPKIIGGSGLAAFGQGLAEVRLKEVKYRKLGEDVLITGYV
ncbi:bifunctional diaminohydroxyphosphoribosylaminopyrimidine deaminase/5-amino-6-(5-phosphoribosylamino)uracil reductase RibD [bacterium]|nr:bifunctional diaminohydroxyphosphoribosylaminopyrimidine deaminase/5-amino-6-(5-phosphoribosylamino)uracil reductase RibD [bacterium]